MKTASYSDAGSFISATMRPQDLIPCFLENARAYANCPEERAQLDEIKKRMKSPGYCESDDVEYDLEELFDLLNEAAPAGHYFGARPGDGADYGFWESEEDAYDLDDGEETETDNPRATTTDPTEGD